MDLKTEVHYCVGRPSACLLACRAAGETQMRGAAQGKKAWTTEDEAGRRAVDLQQSFRIRPCARADEWAVELRPKNVLASPL